MDPCVNKNLKSITICHVAHLVGTWNVSRCLKNCLAQKVLMPSFSNSRSTW